MATCIVSALALLATAPALAWTPTARLPPLRRSSGANLRMGRESEGVAVDCQMPDVQVRRLDKQDMPHISLSDGEGVFE